MFGWTYTFTPSAHRQPRANPPPPPPPPPPYGNYKLKKLKEQEPVPGFDISRVREIEKAPTRK